MARRKGISFHFVRSVTDEVLPLLPEEAVHIHIQKGAQVKMAKQSSTVALENLEISRTDARVLLGIPRPRFMRWCDKLPEGLVAPHVKGKRFEPLSFRAVTLLAIRNRLRDSGMVQSQTITEVAGVAEIWEAECMKDGMPPADLTVALDTEDPAENLEVVVVAQEIAAGMAAIVLAAEKAAVEKAAAKATKEPEEAAEEGDDDWDEEE